MDPFRTAPRERPRLGPLPKDALELPGLDRRLAARVPVPPRHGWVAPLVVSAATALPIVIGVVVIVFLVLLDVFVSAVERVFGATHPDSLHALYADGIAQSLHWIAVLLALAAVSGIAAFVWQRRRPDRRKILDAEIAWVGFPIADYVAWVAADVPMFDVTFARPVDVAELRDVAGRLAGAIELHAIDRTRMRVAMPADRVLFARVAGVLADRGVVAIDMGGRVLTL